MKISPVVALFTVCAPLVAQAQTVAPAALPMAPKSAETADAFVWRFAPPVGSKWTMRSFARSNSITSVPAIVGEKAQAIQFKMMQKMTFDYDVLSRDSLGATTIRMTLREMSNDLTLMTNGKVTTPPSAKKVDPKAVDGATFTIKQAPDGKVWGVVGMRAFQRRMLEADGALDAATITQLLDSNPMMGGNSGESEMMNSMGIKSGTLPTSPIRTGENWKYNVMLPAPLKFQINGTRTLKSLDAGFAVVADSATYEDGNTRMEVPKMADMPGFSVDYSRLKGTVKSTSRVQRSSGLALETTGTTTLLGSITTGLPAANGTPAQSLTLPMNVTSSVRTVMEPR